MIEKWHRLLKEAKAEFFEKVRQIIKESVGRNKENMKNKEHVPVYEESKGHILREEKRVQEATVSKTKRKRQVVWNKGEKREKSRFSKKNTQLYSTEKHRNKKNEETPSLGEEAVKSKDPITESIETCSREDAISLETKKVLAANVENKVVSRGEET